MPNIDLGLRSLRKTFENRMDRMGGCMDWELSPGLFGADVGGNIYDFEAENYVYFLDHIRSLGDLLRGLSELSPLADDALDVAERMDEQGFLEFKIALAHERGLKARVECGSKISPRYDHLLIPELFLAAIPVAEQCEAPLGAALVRMMTLRLREEERVR